MLFCRQRPFEEFVDRPSCELPGTRRAKAGGSNAPHRVTPPRLGTALGPLHRPRCVLAPKGVNCIYLSGLTVITGRAF